MPVDSTKTTGSRHITRELNELLDTDFEWKRLSMRRLTPRIQAMERPSVLEIWSIDKMDVDLDAEKDEARWQTAPGRRA